MNPEPGKRSNKATADRTSGVLTVRCPHCAEANVLPGWDQMFMFLCHFCGDPVEVEEPIQ